MSEVAINACYGRFGLSEAAVERYSELKGLGLTKWRDPEWSTSIYWKTSDGGYWDNGSIPRDDPILVQVVKELGDKANGFCACLRVETITPGTLYRIEEYDGLEGIETRDGIEWTLSTWPLPPIYPRPCENGEPT